MCGLVDGRAWEPLELRFECIFFVYPQCLEPGLDSLTRTQQVSANTNPTLITENPANCQAVLGGVTQVASLQGLQVVPSPPALLTWHPALA